MEDDTFFCQPFCVGFAVLVVFFLIEEFVRITLRDFQDRIPPDRRFPIPCFCFTVTSSLLCFLFSFLWFVTSDLS